MESDDSFMVLLRDFPPVVWHDKHSSGNNNVRVKIRIFLLDLKFLILSTSNRLLVYMEIAFSR